MSEAKDAVFVCTLSSDDSGDACRHCGYPSGAGHGKARA